MLIAAVLRSCIPPFVLPTVLLTILAALAPARAAEATRAVVELFTSQGCSACPPADRLILELAREPGIVALSLPVDYWDYLGWRDTLAERGFSARQRAYAERRGDRQIYTPQAVVNGVAARVGSDRAEVAAAVRGGPAALPVPVRVSEEGERIAVEVGAAPEGAHAVEDAGEHAEVWLVPVSRRREVAIGRGENTGRTATYANVVRGLARLGGWSGTPRRYEIGREAARVGGADAYVVIVQAGGPGGPGPVLGAAKGPGL